MTVNVTDVFRKVRGVQANLDADPKSVISDPDFINDVKRLKRLRRFFQQQTIHVSLPEGTVTSLGQLNLLRYGQSGREPNEEEWAAVERHTATFFNLLNEPLR